MVDLGPMETAEGHLGGARPVPAGHSRYQEVSIEVRRAGADGRAFTLVVGACPTLTVLLRRMICDQLRRS
jgi:hypothetical protein